MTMKPMPQYFIIKVPILEEKQKREKDGRFFIPSDFVWMTRNTQHGEIVAIGKRAAEEFPEARIGDTLIVHHFVQGKINERSDKLIHFDDEYNYYVVSATESSTARNECYGIFNGKEIIPHRDYIFLEKREDKKSVVEEKIGSIHVVRFESNRADVEEQLQKIKEEILSLSKSGMRPDIVKAIQEKEAEQERLSAQINKKEYIKYGVEYANHSRIKKGDIVYALNQACNTTIDFMGKAYRVVEMKYLAGIAV